MGRCCCRPTSYRQAFSLLLLSVPYPGGTAGGRGVGGRPFRLFIPTPRVHTILARECSLSRRVDASASSGTLLFNERGPEDKLMTVLNVNITASRLIIFVSTHTIDVSVVWDWGIGNIVRVIDFLLVPTLISPTITGPQVVQHRL